MRFLCLHFFALVLVASGLTSCSTVLYTTVGQNTPLFHQKGETSVDGALGGTERTTGFSLMAGHSVSDKIALIGSYYNLNLGSGDSGGTISYLELGGGWYRYEEVSHMTIEIFGGIGSGSILDRFTVLSGTGGNVNTSYIKPFIQPSIGVSGKVGEIAFTPRIGLVSYTSHTNTILDPQTSGSIENFFKNNGSALVFEPGLTARLGYRNFKLQFQFNYSTFPSTLPYPYSVFEYADKTYFSLGFHYVFSSRWK